MIKEDRWEWRECKKCSYKFKVRIKHPKQYCSLKCRLADIEGPKNPNYNNKWSVQQKTQARDRVKNCIILGQFPIYTNTKPHLKLESLLQELDFKVDKEVCFGGFLVDCFLPEFHVALEADGPFHSKRRDRKRDSFILENYNVPILRFESTVLMNPMKELDIKNSILSFVDTYKGSVKEREQDSKLKEFGAVITKDFKSWKKDKMRKQDTSTGVLYWVALEYKQFICPTCGKNMLVAETDKRKYCSSFCANKRPNRAYALKIVLCKFCKKAFKSNDWKTRKYCSHDCYKQDIPSWNTGLTKETSTKLKLIGEHISKAKCEQSANKLNKCKKEGDNPFE